MTDRMLRYLLWQGFRVYLSRRISVYKRRAIVGGVGAVVVVGVVAAGRKATSSSSGS